jgi:pantoate--beta-alanine ligase
VTTVVCKLFNLVQPHRAYFGRKDAQQLRVIRKMVQDLNLPMEIVPVATVREPDGLALSSRNVYLNPQERQAATVLYRALKEAERLYQAGERNAEVLRQAMLRVLQAEPLVTKIDYVSVAADDTLEELSTLRGPALVSLAVHIGSTRLIDNIELGAG